MLKQKKKKKKKRSVPLKEWTVEDVLTWLSNYGVSLGTPKRFDKYRQLFTENKINGSVLSGLDRIDLANIGVEDDDAHDLFIGIRELKNIIQVPINVGSLTNQNKVIDKEDKEEDEEDGQGQDEEEEEEEEEEDGDNAGGGDGGDADENAGGGGGDGGAEEVKQDENWEAPFLPFMYEAPAVKLSSKTIVKVESARVVQPFNKRAFALYELWVTEGDNEWILSKRYNEFHKLHDQ
ncbi:hypothetical protein RFI_07772, partial [Reticulomyxa filosa]